MSKKKLIKKKGKNLKSFLPGKIKVNLIDPIKVIEKTKNKIDNYYTNFVKNREKEKRRLEKKKIIDQKKEEQRQKKQAQKEKLNNHNGKIVLVHGVQMFNSSSMFTLEPKVGDFYFFPNYLMHTVYPFYDSDEERRSVSFNAVIDENIYNTYNTYG